MPTQRDVISEFIQLDESVESGQWRQAELAWTACRLLGMTQREFADAVVCAQSHVTTLIRVWSHWSDHRADRPKFSDAYNMATTGAATPEHAADIRREKDAISKVRNLPVETRASIARELIQDPAVVAELRPAPLPHRDGSQPETRQPSILDVVNEIGRARYHLQNGFRIAVGANLSEEAKFQVGPRLAELDLLLIQFREFLAGKNLNEALEEILGGI